MKPPDPLTCAAADCENPFYPVVPQQKFCCNTCANRTHVRNSRARHRKGGGGGGGGGGGNGGGGGPTLFDTITPQDSRAIYAPDTCYRTPAERRKPAQPAPQDQESGDAAA